MPTQVYQLPDLLGLLPKSPAGYLHPHIKQADEEFSIWVEKTFEPSFARDVYLAKIPHLAALMSPRCSYQDLRTITDYILLTLILEVLTDDRSSTEAMAITQTWMRTLQEIEVPEGFDHPLIQTMRREIVPSIKAAIDPFYWPQLLATSKEFSSDVVNEAIDREAYANHSSVRDIPAYMEMRRGSAGLRLFFTFTRVCRNIRIPDDVLEHPVVRGMEDAAADMNAITNDIYSFKKECGHEECLNNIISVMQYDQKTSHLSLQKRFDYAGKLWAEALDHFEAYKRKLPSFSEEMDKQLASYADMVIENVVGQIEWSLVVPRYHVFDSESDQKNNILRLG